jgi:DNA-binding MarR family transcriptional regulator
LRYSLITVATSRSIPHLTRLSRRVYANATPELLGMNLKQVSMLAALRHQGALQQTELCGAMKTTQNTMVAWLNELEERGYVARARDPDDRRKHNVAITDTGIVALDRADEQLRKLEDDALVGLSSDDRAQLRRLLAKALDALE